MGSQAINRVNQSARLTGESDREARPPDSLSWMASHRTRPVDYCTVILLAFLPWKPLIRFVNNKFALEASEVLIPAVRRTPRLPLTCSSCYEYRTPAWSPVAATVIRLVLKQAVAWLLGWALQTLHITKCKYLLVNKFAFFEKKPRNIYRILRNNGTSTRTSTRIEFETRERRLATTAECVSTVQ